MSKHSNDFTAHCQEFRGLEEKVADQTHNKAHQLLRDRLEGFEKRLEDSFEKHAQWEDLHIAMSEQSKDSDAHCEDFRVVKAKAAHSVDNEAHQLLQDRFEGVKKRPKAHAWKKKRWQ